MKKISCGFCAVLMVLFVFVGGIYASEWSDADFYRLKDKIVEGAEQGQVGAQSALGWMYMNGRGVAQDYEEAAKWFRRASEQGDVDSQVKLGVLYSRGDGVVQDYREAVRWYKRAAEQGYALAQVFLGGKYEQGQGVVQDYNEAVRWYRRAAEQRDDEGMFALGNMYYGGLGVAQDYVQAHMLWNVAAANGHSGAINNRDNIAQIMTSEQIAEAQRLAREWMEKYQQ